MEPELYWDATYAIVLALVEHHPHLFPENVGLEELFHLIVRLPGFADDPDLANEQHLLDILGVWFEEVSS